jgi:hypothetical protein
MTPDLSAAESAKAVNIYTFVRAESDAAFKNIYDRAGGFGKFVHHRGPVLLTNRMSSG